MALFAKKSRAPSPDDVARLRARRYALAAQLETAKSDAEAKLRAVEQLLIDDGEPAILEKAQNALADTERHARSLDGAIHTLDADIASKEAEIAAAADKKLRAETAAALEVNAKEVAAAAVAFIAGAKQFADATAKVAGTIWEIQRMNSLAAGLVSDVETASAIAENLIREHARAVSNGSAPAKLPQPEAPTPQIVQPPTPTVRVFATRGMKWHAAGADASFVQYSPMINIAVDLLPDHADRAIALNAAMPISDKRVHDIARVNSPKRVGPEECLWVDGSIDEPVEIGPEAFVRVPEFSRRARAGV